MSVSNSDGLISSKSPRKRRDRSEYMKKYYQEHTAAKKAKYKENRQSKKYYMSQKDVTTAIRKVQSQIGRVNTDIVLTELKKINKIFIDVNV